MVRSKREVVAPSPMHPSAETGKIMCIRRYNMRLTCKRAFMNAKERKAYIGAVQCLLASPSRSDPVLVPGAKTRYDDFVAQHINQTGTIHGTGNFLSWHRYFVHGYEKALKEECGYKGSQPYWNWFSHQDDLTKHPIFDGSATSLGGDGEYVKHDGSAGGRGTIKLPSGAGGGCIKEGPLKG